MCERYAIRAKRHALHPNLVQLKYSQISSPMHERIVQECRGLIVDEWDGWRVVCRAYDKFFNLGEPNAAAIDWSTAKVYDKLDGSLMSLYHYKGDWHVASSGLPDAAGLAHESGVSFAELFRRTWSELNYPWPSPDERDHCFLFELMTPHNRVVVAHDRPRLVLHGVRDRASMFELEPDPIARQYGWECVKSHPLTCADDCLSAAKALSGLHAEGFVVRDAVFNRVKIKSPQYVALSQFKENVTGRRLLEIARANESDEFLSYFPELSALYCTVRREYDALCEQLEADYLKLRGIASQKDFAAAAMKSRCSSPLFALRAGKAKSVREFFAAATIQSIERALGVDLDALIAPPADEGG